jgi:hypothetical protein
VYVVSTLQDRQRPSKLLPGASSALPSLRGQRWQRTEHSSGSLSPLDTGWAPGNGPRTVMVRLQPSWHRTWTTLS